MTEKVAVLVPAFALRKVEPNPCNKRLAREALRICESLVKDGYHPVLVVQWEVELALKKLGKFDEYDQITTDMVCSQGVIEYGGTIEQRADGGYLGTQEVLDDALTLFREHRCTSLVVVANPFIHQQYTYWLARKSGLKLKWKRVKWIGFDKQSTQWWCRSWYQFLWQTVRLAVGLEHGYKGRQAPQS